MEAIMVVMLIAKCLTDSYLERLSTKNIGVFVLVLVFLRAIFCITNTTPIYNFTLLSNFVGAMVDDFETNEVYRIGILFFMICSIIASVFSSFFVRSFLILLIPVIFNFLIEERFMGMMDCLIILRLDMSKSPTDLANLVFYLGIVGGIRVLIYIIRKEEGEEVAFVPVIWLSFLLYVVMGNVF